MAGGTGNGNRRELLLGAALCAVLIALAVLQYRWIGQVGEAERIRLDRDLRTSIDRFTQDFDGELIRLAASVIGGAAAGGDATERLALWRETARYPEVVKRVASGTGEELPGELREMVARMPRRGGGPGGPPVVVDGNVPAIALSTDGMNWVWIELDLDFIRHTWLPELAASHFGPEYHVEVSGPRGVLYRTDDEPARDVDEAGRGGLFALRGGPFGRGKGPEPKGPPPEPRSDKGPPLFAKGRGGGPGEPRWRVAAAYKGGTLDERVAAVRTRNLAVSFGMLLLMGVSVGMLIVSSRRARALARQQMEFVAGVTHELRTPLAVISSASQNLADGVTTTAEQTRRYGTVIRDQGKRLTDMVEQILRFAGLASGRAEVRRQPVDIAELIEQAVADCRPDLAASGAELTREIAPDLPPVSGDPASLVHALRNLLGNAIKHGEGAAVRLEARVVQGSVEVAIEDKGPGIDAADLAHIFEPFYRGRRAMAEQIQGTGLGLSLVKKIAEAHDGTVEIASRPGEGARFVMRLPTAKDDA